MRGDGSQDQSWWEHGGIRESKREVTRVQRWKVRLEGTETEEMESHEWEVMRVQGWDGMGWGYKIGR
jgi:hypothetical protein